MKKVEMLFISTEVKTQMVKNLMEANDLSWKVKEEKIEGYKLFNSGLNESEVTHSNTKFGKGELNGLFILNDSNFAEVEDLFLEQYEIALTDVSTKPTKDKTATWLVKGKKAKKGLFAAKKAEIVEDSKTQIVNGKEYL